MSLFHAVVGLDPSRTGEAITPAQRGFAHRDATTRGADRNTRAGRIDTRLMVVAVLAVAALLGAAGSAFGQVAGASRLGSTQVESSRVAMGWSAKVSILGQDMFNDEGAKVGRVEDLVVDREKSVSYLIVAVGGLVGKGRHAVAIPTSQVQVQGDRIVLVGASPEALAALPPFIYAPSTRSHSSIVARAERDMDEAAHRIARLEAQADSGSDQQKRARAEQIAELKRRQLAVVERIAAMNAAQGADWKSAELEVRKASLRLRRVVDSAPDS